MADYRERLHANADARKGMVEVGRHAVQVFVGLTLAAGSWMGLAVSESLSAAQIDCGSVAPTSATATPRATPASIAEVAFPKGGETLTVFAAASLTDAFDEFATTLENANAGLEIVIQTGGSQTLVTQLREGAEADVLATANNPTMATAVEAGMISGEPVHFTGNRLVIVAPPANPAGIASLDDLAKDDVLLVVANSSVPAGAYAREVLCVYGDSEEAAEGFVDAIDGNIVSEEEDVRNVLAKVQLGEADAGIVYASDAVAAELGGAPVAVIEFPACLPLTARYPIAAVEGGNIDLTNAFIAAILSSEGQAVLAKYGFG